MSVKWMGQAAPSGGIDELPVLDKTNAIKQLGDAELFETMLEGFEEMSMRKNLIGIKIAIDELDYFNVRVQAHSLKGSASYVHAERVKTAAEKLYTDIDSKNVEGLFKDYPILVKQCIILKKTIRFEGCKKKKGQFKDDDTDFDIPLSKFYKIMKRSALDFDVMQISKPSTVPQIPAYEFNSPASKKLLPNPKTPNDSNSNSTNSRSVGDDSHNPVKKAKVETNKKQVELSKMSASLNFKGDLVLPKPQLATSISIQGKRESRNNLPQASASLNNTPNSAFLKDKQPKPQNNVRSNSKGPVKMEGITSRNGCECRLL